MSDADSQGEGVYPHAVTARLTTQTYEQLESYAEEHTEGRITVAAREVIEDSLEHGQPPGDGKIEELQDNAPIFLFASLVGVLFILWGEPVPPQEVTYATIGLFTCWLALQFYPHKLLQVIDR